MAPPPPTLAKFAGFVEWSHQQRAQGHGVCFGIVPDGMTAAVGIFQVRLMPTLSDAEWGFVLSTHFWSTEVFSDAANVVVEFAFTTMHVERLEARIALRNRRAHSAVQKLGARFETTLAGSSPEGIPRDPQSVWTLREHDWRNRARDPRVSAHDAAQRIRTAVEAAESEVRRSDAPRQSNRIRCSCLTAADENDAASGGIFGASLRCLSGERNHAARTQCAIRRQTRSGPMQ